VELQPWIELPTGEQLSKILADPQSLKVVRAAIKCKGCSKTYTFELSLLPDRKRERGIRPFPENGRFKCPVCETLHHTRDIEGQLRLHLGKQSESAAS
jgi:hypothetical protein